MGRTALMVACLTSNERIVRTLLAQDGLDVSAQDNDGNTALIHAAMSKSASHNNSCLHGDSLVFMRSCLPTSKPSLLGRQPFI